MKLLFALSCLCLVNLPARALSVPTSEPMSLKISSQYDLFRDGKFSCANTFFRDFIFFHADLVNGSMSHAGFGLGDALSFPADDIDLTEEEMRGIELYRDSRGRLWLKKLPLSSRLFAWVLAHLDSDVGVCSVTGLATSSLAAPTFEFELGGVQDGILVSYSRAATQLHGLAGDGSSYEISGLYLVQTISK